MDTHRSGEGKYNALLEAGDRAGRGQPGGAGAGRAIEALARSGVGAELVDQVVFGSVATPVDTAARSAFSG